MKDSELYTPGARQLQDSFDSRRIADRAGLESSDCLSLVSDRDQSRDVSIFVRPYSLLMGAGTPSATGKSCAPSS